MNDTFPSLHLMTTLARASAVACLALAATHIQAGENYRLRQSPVGTLGGEMAAPADAPGFFGTATLTYIEINKVTDASGNGISTPTGGTLTAAPLTGYTLTAPANPIEFRQTQTNINLVGGHLSEQTYADGRIAVAVNVPLVQIHRSFAGTLGAGTLTTPTGAVVPSTNAASISANAAAAAQWSTLQAAQNQSVTGLGDAELSALWIRHADRLKVAAGGSLFVPTGSYDKNRGPNPGFGNFYTLRVGGAVTYALDPNHSENTFDKGVTLSGRLGYGTNTRNKDTSYKSGDFIYGEVGILKVTGPWGFGGNLLRTQQITGDDGPTASATCLGGVDANGCRYSTWGISPFLAYKLPGKDAGFNLQYTHNFGGRNAIQVNAVQLRFIKAW